MSKPKPTNYNEMEMLSILEEVRDYLKALPKEHPTPVTELSVKGSVKVENPQTEVRVINLKELTEKMTSLIEATKANKPVQNVKIINQKEFPKTIKINELEKYLKIMKEIADREPEIIVKENKIEFPRKAQDAIPVVLTDANRQGFYNALTAVASAVRTAVSAQAQANLEAMQFENGKLKTTAVIDGDVVVDNVGLENVAGTKINPATNEGLEDIVTAIENITVTVDTTGLATSAKQLPDNHQVTVSNPTADPETGLAKETTLAKLIEKPTCTYTWDGETLTQKVAVYADRTETTNYTCTDGKLTGKVTVIT